MKKNITFPKGKEKGVNKTSIGRQEKDIDDLVHDEVSETDSVQNEEDPDDKVHRIERQESSQLSQANTGMEDPDDLVHGYQEEDED